MATMKSVILLAMTLILVASQPLAHAQPSPQTCSASLQTLNACTQFVVPGGPSTPNAACCGALRGVDKDCLCSTIRISSRMPTQCNLPPLNCGNYLYTHVQSGN